jgi:glutathione transport system permease protein
MNKQFGLDDPVHVRFAKYVAKLLTLDLGIRSGPASP